MSPYGFGNAIPVGGIIAWYGLAANIPAGWARCDGGGGTPDLRGYFLRGASAGLEPAGPFGAANHTHPAAGAHQHAAAGGHDHGGTALGNTDMHDHAAWGTEDVDDVGGGATASAMTSISGAAPAVSVTIAGQADHQHAGAADHQHAQATTMPQHHTVHFIMRMW